MVDLSILPQLDAPTCAVCGRMVDRFDVYKDPYTCRWTLVARCHGDMETVVVDVEEILAVGTNGVRYGQAFCQPLLARATERLLT